MKFFPDKFTLYYYGDLLLGNFTSWQYFPGCILYSGLRDQRATVSRVRLNNSQKRAGFVVFRYEYLVLMEIQGSFHRSPNISFKQSKPLLKNLRDIRTNSILWTNPPIPTGSIQCQNTSYSQRDFFLRCYHRIPDANPHTIPCVCHR